MTWGLLTLGPYPNGSVGSVASDGPLVGAHRHGHGILHLNHLSDHLPINNNPDHLDPFWLLNGI